MSRFPSLTPTLSLAVAACLLWPLAGTAKPAEASPARGPGHPLGNLQGSDPCREFVARLPNVKAPLCAAAELKPTVGRTVQGRTLFQRDVVAPESRIRVLVVGAMHGDELSSSSVAVHWIQLALQTPS